MENSVDATIEKIKLQEQIKEAELKEKRKFATLNRSIRDSKAKADKINQDIIHIRLAIDILQHQVDVEKYTKNALSNEVEKFYTELNQLRRESERNIASVWELRANLSEAMKHVADSCDIRTLLIKTTNLDSSRILNTRKQHLENILLMRKKLQNAQERRAMAINKRRLLLEKPEKDDEFIRIKEALHYSEKMVANFKMQDME